MSLVGTRPPTVDEWKQYEPYHRGRLDKLFSHAFKTNDSASFRYHTDKENLLQMIYMIIAGYFEDDASDELTNDPVFKAVLNKDALVSQPTVSRFFNRMDEDTLNQFLTIGRILRKRVYSIQMPQAVILDLDSTLFDAYGKQEGSAFNFHYQSNGYKSLTNNINEAIKMHMVITFIINKVRFIKIFDNFGICCVNNMTTITSQDAMVFKSISSGRKG